MNNLGGPPRNPFDGIMTTIVWCALFLFLVMLILAGVFAVKVVFIALDDLTKLL